MGALFACSTAYPWVWFLLRGALRIPCFAQICHHSWRRCQQELSAEALSSPSSPIASVQHTVRYMPADYRTPPMMPRQQRLRSASGGAAHNLRP